MEIEYLQPATRLLKVVVSVVIVSVAAELKPHPFKVRTSPVFSPDATAKFANWTLEVVETVSAWVMVAWSGFTQKLIVAEVIADCPLLKQILVANV